MARVRYARRFERDLEAVTSPQVLHRIERSVRRLEAFPGLASPDVPASITDEFGPSVRKVVAFPFDIVCEYNEDAGEVRLLALIYCRAAR